MKVTRCKHWVALALSTALLGANGIRPVEATPMSAQELAMAFAPLLRHDHWTTHSRPVGRRDLMSYLVDLDESARNAIRDAYIAGVLTGGHAPHGSRSIQVIALAFESKRAARQFVAAHRKRTSIAGAWRNFGVRDGASRGNARVGFHSVSPDGNRTLQAVLHNGRVLLFRTKKMPELSRDAQDDWIEYALSLRSDAPIARPTVPVLRAIGRDVTVTVLDPAGKPVANGEISAAFRRDWQPIKLGVARLRVFRKRTMFTVRNATDASGRKLAQSMVNAQWSDDEVILTLAHVSVTKGRIVNAAGQPMADVTIEAARSPNGPFGGSSVTGVDGRFRIEGLLSRLTYAVALRDDQGALSSDHATIKAGDDLDIQAVRKATAAARIRVLDPDGLPLEGALTEIPNARVGYHANANGEITVRGLEAGESADVVVRAPFERRDVAPRKIRIYAGEDHEVQLPRGWTLRGSVQDRQGHRRLRYLTYDDGVRPARPIGFWPVDEFELRQLPVGPVKIVFHEARQSPESKRLAQTFWPGPYPVVLHVNEAPKLVVRARAPDGSFVSSFTAKWRLRSERGFGTARDGVATLAIPPTDAVLSVYDARDPNGERLNLAVATQDIGPKTQDVLVHLLPGRTISGWVTFQGEPLGGIPVTAKRVGTPRFVRTTHASAVSKPDGSFTLVGLANQPYDIHARPTDRRSASPPPILVPADEDVVAIALPTAVRIRVEGPDGRPLHDARVVVSSEAGTTAANTNVEGLAWVRSAKGTTLRVRAPYPIRTLGTSRQSDWDGTETTVTLRRTVQLAGRIRRDGRALADAYVLLHPGGQHHRTDRSGRFRFAKILGPVHAIRVTDPADPEHQPWFRSPTEGDFAIDFAKDAQLHGWIQVRNANEGDEGWIQGQAGTSQFATPQRFVFASDGLAYLPALRPGQFTVWVPKVGDTGACAHSSALPFQRLVLKPTIRKTETLSFRIQAPEGTALPDISVRDPVGKRMYVRPTRDGYSVDGLPRIRWRIQIKARALKGWVGADVHRMPGDATTTIQLTPIK